MSRQRLAAASAACLLLLLLLLGCFSTSARAAIELGQDGRYSGIVVSIDGSIEPDWSLLDKLKAAFQWASGFLAVATKPVANGTRSFAFGSVRFLLPASWSGGNGSAARSLQAVAGDPPTGDSADEAEEAQFRVHRGSGSAGPWTVQPLGCGQPGLFSLLPAPFIAAVDEKSLGQSLVHEFAHLRWGVFDEYNGHEGPHGYLKGRRIEPVRCSEPLRGALQHNETGGHCSVDRVTNQLEPNCRFYVYLDQPAADASIMYVRDLDSLRHFCASIGAEPQLAHNVLAPNPHNTQCMGASVRQVLARHPDFVAGPEVTDPNTAVNFTEVLPRLDRRVVVVMDVSRSMRGQPMEKMKQAIQSFLHQLDQDAECGLIAFSTGVQLLMPLGRVNDSASRQAYWEQVRNLTALGVTATGDALAAALELLGCDLSQPSKSHTGQALLITDGEENSRVRYSLDEAIDIARRTSVSVDTVAFGRLADARLAGLSAATGGIAHLASLLGPVNDLATSLAQSAGRRRSATGAAILLASSQLPSNSSLPVGVDQSASSGLQFFAVSRARPAALRLRLETPSGDIIEGRSDPDAGIEFDVDEQLGSAIMKLSGRVQPGKWKLHIRSGQAGQSTDAMPASAVDDLSVIVTARAAAASDSDPADWRPTLLRGFLSQWQAELNSRTRVSVHAYLMRGGAEFVRQADLWARVESDDGPVASFRLFDHGAGADVTKGDGIHSAYLPLHLMAPAGAQDYGISLQCLSPVSRVGSAGKFAVTGVDLGDLAALPPARVTDLDCGINTTSGDVRLRWTAVGDWLDSGTAADYQVRISDDRAALTEDFDSAENVTAPLEPPPLPAGQQQTLTISAGQIPSYNGTFYLALRAVSSAGRLSDLSNVVSAQLMPPDNVDEIEAGAASTAVSNHFTSSTGASSLKSSTGKSSRQESSTGASSSMESSTGKSSSQESSTGTSSSLESSTGASTQESSTAASTQESSTAASTQESSTGASTQESSTGASTQESSTGASTQESSTGASTQESSPGASTQESSTGASTQESSTPSVLESSTETSTQVSSTSSSELQQLTSWHPPNSRTPEWLLIALISAASASMVAALFVYIVYVRRCNARLLWDQRGGRVSPT